ncbi:16S rRNA (guanine(527)-N(7))-methyltransferase RsmG [Marispirochaeta sp.]|jgi:16S rRNA (guanine527-N7)-methyltransferase|uniref:16S rRNA (guanine(527)-N(7))-methyltransferase RsmG n=1 Tax=Marispirochaeta sp. TaxID=2038653 RepID=UPI0029C742A1|nr:16S rRNA (guanine(527)-N(7))-methyltransferase RsmG [Marispirochaeta sp.]
MDYREELARGLASIGLEYEEEQIEALLSYLKELLFWNSRFNLIKTRESDLVRRHIIDALAAVPIIGRSMNGTARLADVGSGAGIPGIPLAVFLQGIQLLLIERSGKRAGFLRSAVVAAGLGKRSEVIHSDVRSCGIEADAVVMRAFKPLPEALALVLPLMGNGGTIFAFHGRRETIQKELEDPLVKEFRWILHPLPSGAGGEERHLLQGSHGSA